jgi:hypothetical protein
VEQQKLQQWIAAHGTPLQVAVRCRIILAAAAGEPNWCNCGSAFDEPQYGSSLAKALC